MPCMGSLTERRRLSPQGEGCCVTAKRVRGFAPRAITIERMRAPEFTKGLGKVLIQTNARA